MAENLRDKIKRIVSGVKKDVTGLPLWDECRTYRDALNKIDNLVSYPLAFRIVNECEIEIYRENSNIQIGVLLRELKPNGSYRWYFNGMNEKEIEYLLEEMKNLNKHLE